MPADVMLEGRFRVANFVANMASVGSVKYRPVHCIRHLGAHDGVLDALASLIMYCHMGEIHFPVLEHPFTDRALVVFGFETRLLVEVHVRLRGSQVLALTIANGARKQLGIQIRVMVVDSHMHFVMALKPECLQRQKKYII